ncbi:hypothetical protein [Aeromonas veronii]
MQNLIIRGAVGGVAILLFLGLPIWWAAKLWGVTSIAVLLPISLAIDGLSDVPFEHQNILFLYTLGLLFIWLQNQDNRGVR